MSSFGGIPLDMNRGSIDYVVSRSNKCLQGIPGFSFAIARKDAINETKGWARSVSLDMYSQMAGLDKNGQLRFSSILPEAFGAWISHISWKDFKRRLLPD